MYCYANDRTLYTTCIYINSWNFQLPVYANDLVGARFERAEFEDQAAASQY